MKAVAIFNFDSRNENELSFKVGQIIEVNIFLSSILKFLNESFLKIRLTIMIKIGSLET